MRIRWSGKLFGRGRQTGTGAYVWPSAAGAPSVPTNVKVGQLPIESPDIAGTVKVQVAQLPFESPDLSGSVKVQVSSLPIEIEEFAQTIVKLQVAQLPIEVVYPFRCGDVVPPSPLPPTIIPIRRLRRAPHLSDREFWTFYQWLEMDVQTGVLPPDVQHAIVTLRWSDDGGHTWSEPWPIDVGPLASYGERAIWRRLGRARDRVFEVSMTDPILWAICAAYLGLTEGTS